MATPIPFTIRISILLLILSEHTLAFMMPTIVVYMMEFLIPRCEYPSNYESTLYYYAGILEGTNRFMAFIGSMAWGMISDKISRKYSLLIVLSGVFVTSIGFGLSTSFEIALFWRILSGCFSGTISITKAMLRDLSDDSNIAVLYSYFGSGYGLASIVGPVIGGLLSHPYRLSSIFSSSFFYDFPYFLPMLIHALLILISMIMVSWKVPYISPSTPIVKSSHSLTSNKKYINTVFIFCLMALSQFSYRILIALWVKLDNEDLGIGWDTEENPGLMNSFSGVIVTLFPLMFTPMLSVKFGVKRSCLLLIGGLIPVILGISWGYLMNGIALWTSLVVLNGLSIAFSTVFISFISIAVSNSVEAAQAGSAMGVCQSAASLTRAIATTGTAALFAWNQGLQLSFPFNAHLLFLLNALLLAFSFVYLNITFDKSLEKRAKTTQETPLLQKI